MERLLSKGNMENTFVTNCARVTMIPTPTIALVTLMKTCAHILGLFWDDG